VTLRSTAAAYGYTLTIATTMATLTSTVGSPATDDLFLLVAGGLLAFALLEAVLLATRPADGRDVQHAFPFAGALNFASVGGALGVATLLARWIDGTTAWLVAPFGATAAYMLLVAAQVAVVHALRR
jgi:hypothetical protein